MEDKIVRQKVKNIISLWASIKEEDNYSDEYVKTRLEIEEKLVDLAVDENFKDDLKVIMEASAGNGFNDPNTKHVKIEIRITRENDDIKVVN